MRKESRAVTLGRWSSAPRAVSVRKRLGRARATMLAVGLMLTLRADTQPAIGQFCPPGFTYDQANCVLDQPLAPTNPTINGTLFVYTSATCAPLFIAAPGNLCTRVSPPGYSPFIFGGRFYVKPSGHYVQRIVPSCPAGSTYDSAHCFFGVAPAGRVAGIYTNHFIFNRTPFQSCPSIRPGSVALTPFRCSVGLVPAGYTPFIFNNGWYVQPKQIATGDWQVRDYISDPPTFLRNTCLPPPPPRSWQLQWSDEFDDAPDDQKCFTSDDHLRCILRPEWNISGGCQGAPVDWRASAVPNWTHEQQAKFGGLRNLNKCRWSVFESFNAWEVWTKPPNAVPERMNAYRPENVHVTNGILTVATNEHPKPANGDGYCCGVKIDAGPPPLWSQDCPYSGALIATPTGLPWTSANNPADSDPDKRYIGFAAPYGRIEFRARMTKLGHGGWMSLWLFVDQADDPNGPGGELDAVEFLADMDMEASMPPDLAPGMRAQIKDQSSTYGMAWQTAHNWYPVNGPPHVGNGIGIPIGLGEWHIYAVEWEAAEVRFFIDNCLTHRLVDGQQFIDRWSGQMQTFVTPKDQTLYIIIGTPASSAHHLAKWYRAYELQTDTCGNGLPGCANATPFQPSEMEVDYVRVYTDGSELQERKKGSTPLHPEIRRSHPSMTRPLPQQR